MTVSTTAAVSANATGAEWRRRLRAALPALSLALVIAGPWIGASLSRFFTRLLLALPGIQS